MNPFKLAVCVASDTQKLKITVVKKLHPFSTQKEVCALVQKARALYACTLYKAEYGMIFVYESAISSASDGLNL